MQIVMTQAIDRCDVYYSKRFDDKEVAQTLYDFFYNNFSKIEKFRLITEDDEVIIFSKEMLSKHIVKIIPNSKEEQEFLKDLCESEK